MAKPKLSEIKIFIDFAFQTHNEHIGHKLVITGCKDGALIKRLLSIYSLDELKKYWLFFLSMDDYFIVSVGRTIAIFSNQINKVAHKQAERQKADRMAYKPPYHVELI